MTRQEALSAGINRFQEWKALCLKKGEPDWSGSHLRFMAKEAYRVEGNDPNGAYAKPALASRIDSVREALSALKTVGALCPRCEGPKAPFFMDPPEDYEPREHELDRLGRLLACEDCKP